VDTLAKQQRHPYEGPYRVLKKNSDLVYSVECLNKSKKIRRPKEELVHVSRMKPYFPRSSRDDDLMRGGTVNVIKSYNRSAENVDSITKSH